MARKKADIKLSYLLAVVIIILIAVIAYLVFVKPVEIAPVIVTTEEEAVQIQEDLGSSISDIKDDLEGLKKSLGK